LIWPIAVPATPLAPPFLDRSVLYLLCCGASLEFGEDSPHSGALRRFVSSKQLGTPGRSWPCKARLPPGALRLRWCYHSPSLISSFAVLTTPLDVAAAHKPGWSPPDGGAFGSWCRVLFLGHEKRLLKRACTSVAEHPLEFGEESLRSGTGALRRFASQAVGKAVRQPD
jgi:hypothetical protein